MSLQRHAGIAARGIQGIDPAVAVVVRSAPDLLSQLESDAPPAGGDVPSLPQVDLAAEVEQQDLDAQTQA